jgi:MFS family permease
MVRGGVLVAALAMLVSVVAVEFWQFTLARLLLGLGSGAVGPSIRRIVVNRDREALGANLGALASFEVAGFVLGPLLAAITAELLGLRAPFGILAGVFLAVSVVVARLDLSAGAVTTERRVIRGLIAAPAMKAALAAGIAFYVTVGMFEAVWAVLLRDRGAETWVIGLTLSLFTIPMIFLAPIGGRQAQRRGPLRVVTVSLTIAAVCTFSYGLLPSLWLLCLVSFIHALADSFTMPGNQVAVALVSPPEQLSSAQGMLGAAGLAAAGLTGLAAGYVYEHAGRFAVSAATAAVMMLFLGIAIAYGKRSGVQLRTRTRSRQGEAVAGAG